MLGGFQGGGSLQRLPKSIQRCLHEAIRDRELRFLQTARCVHCPGRAQRMSASEKYTANSAKLEVRWAWHCSETAGAPRQMLRPQCSTASTAVQTARCPPRIYPVQARRRCKTRACILKRIEMLKADGDSDVLHPGAQRNGLAPRACAGFSHASLTVSHHICQANPVLHEVLQVLLFPGRALAPSCQHALPFQAA